MVVKNDFFLREEFEKWLETEVGLTTPESRACYIMTDCYPGTDIPYFEIIANLIAYGQLSLARTVLDIWEESIRNNHKGLAAKSVSNKLAYLKKIREFLMKIENSIMKRVQAGVLKPTMSLDDLMDICSGINKSSLSPLDGMEPLINALGEDGIIEMAVESSYFFEPELVKKRFVEMLVDPFSFPKRMENEDDNDKNNGNKPVCSLINEYTGYNLNVNTDVKPFRHYIISHVWGNASDPRYYTALWNVVLIPAWANHLMDKSDRLVGTLASRLKSTFQAICIKLYNLNNPNLYNWPGMNMTCPPVDATADVLRGKYDVRVIMPTQYNRKRVGNIQVREVKI